MRNTAFVVTGILFLILQSNFFRLTNFLLSGTDLVAHFFDNVGVAWLATAIRLPFLFVSTPNLILPLIVFTGVREYAFSTGIALAFVLGYCLDLFGVAPIGLFTFVTVCSFLFARAAGVRLAAQTILTQVALAFVFALLQGILIVVLLAIFGRNPYVPRSLLRTLLPQAICTSLAAPLVFRVARRLDLMTTFAARPAEGARR